jgi:hypothetical protein
MLAFSLLFLTAADTWGVVKLVRPPLLFSFCFCAGVDATRARRAFADLARTSETGDHDKDKRCPHTYIHSAMKKANRARGRQANLAGSFCRSSTVLDGDNHGMDEQ